MASPHSADSGSGYFGRNVHPDAGGSAESCDGTNLLPARAVPAAGRGKDSKAPTARLGEVSAERSLDCPACDSTKGDTGVRKSRVLRASELFGFCSFGTDRGPERFAATRHNVKAWGIAPGNGNIQRGSPERASRGCTNISPLWGSGLSFRRFPGRCPGLSHCVPLARNALRAIGAE